jgi:chemotaxis protein histidine kinase CheA
MGNGVGDVQQMFGAAMDKINADLAKGDQKKLAADLKEAGDQMWNMAAPTYALVQRLEEAHNEWGANKIAADGHYQALLKAHGVLESMTQELVQQQKIEKGRDELATKTITPVHDATDPRIASELKKQLASYLETNKQKAESDQKLDVERMDLEASVTRFFAEQNKKRTEDDFRAAEQQHDAAAKANDEAVKSAETLRKISEMHTTSAASAYLISKQEEQARLRKILQQEQSDLTAGHQREIAEQQSFVSQMSAIAANSSGDARSKALEEAANAQTRLTTATRQYNEEMARTSAAIQASDLQTAKLNNSWAVFFRQSNQELLSLTATLNGQVQTAMKQVTDGFAQGVAKAAIEGKSFGKSMVGVAREMSESMIEGLIKWGMQDLITKMGMKASASMLAGANATASMAGAPWPVDMSAPAFGATMMGTAMAFADGGLVPGLGNADSVPAMLMPGEAVLPKHLTEMLTQTARNGNNGSGQVVHVHNHFSPQIHAVDAEGVDRMLTEHGDTFKRHFTNHARRMNQ